MSRLSGIAKHSFNSSLYFFSGLSKSHLFAKKRIDEHLSPHQAALKKALRQCRKEIKKCKRWHSMPSPTHFEHAAMLSRQSKNYKNEIKICQLYITLVDECISKRKFNKEKFELKAQVLTKPLVTRLQNAKKLCGNRGVDVHYL